MQSVPQRRHSLRRRAEFAGDARRSSRPIVCPSDTKSAQRRHHQRRHISQLRRQLRQHDSRPPQARGHDQRGPAQFSGGGPFIEVIYRANSGTDPTYYSWITHADEYLQGQVRMAEITDGTSNTLAISETVQGKGGDLRGFGWWGGGAHFETLLTPNSPLPDRTEQSCTPAVRLNPPCANRQVGNARRGGNNRRPQPASQRRVGHAVRRLGAVLHEQRRPRRLAGLGPPVAATKWAAIKTRPSAPRWE